MKLIQHQPKGAETVLVITVGLLLIYLWKGHQLWLYLSISIGLIGLLSVTGRNILTFLWIKTGHILGYVNSRILLSLVYFFILLPVAIGRKLFRVNQKINLTKSKLGYYTERNHEYTSKDFEHPW